MDPEAEWWAEEAARHNALGESVRASKEGFVSRGLTEAPKLNPDGSLAEEPAGNVEDGQTTADEYRDFLEGLL